MLNYFSIFRVKVIVELPCNEKMEGAKRKALVRTKAEVTCYMLPVAVLHSVFFFLLFSSFLFLRRAVSCDF